MEFLKSDSPPAPGSLRSCRFTLLMTVAVLAATFVTGTHARHLADEILLRFGFAPIHLSSLEWHRLLTCVFVTVGGAKFYTSIVMLILSVGAAEIRFGTKQTILLFWSVHLLTLLVMSLLIAIPLHHADIWWGTLLATEHDVGPSAGYYGCLGAVVASQPRVRRRWIVIVVMLVLATRLGWAFSMLGLNDGFPSADLAHLLAFPVGVAVQRFVVRN